MAHLVEMKSAMAQMQEQLRELMLAMHQLNSPTQERTRIGECRDVEMIKGAIVSVPNHAPILYCEEPILYCVEFLKHSS